MTDTADRIDEALSTLKNQAGQPVRLRREPGAGVRAALPAGRVVVAPGQAVEASEWGNVTFDQTVQVFANASARNAQWPTPLEGARSWLIDSHTLWVYTGGAWWSPPAGFVAQATGPAAPVNTVSGQPSILLSLPLTVAGRRRLLMSFYWQGNNTSAGSAWLQMVAYTTVLAGITYPSGAWFSSSRAIQRQLTGAGGNSFTVQLQAVPSGGPVNFGANSCQVTVTDMGATS